MILKLCTAIPKNSKTVGHWLSKLQGFFRQAAVGSAIFDSSNWFTFNKTDHAKAIRRLAVFPKVGCFVWKCNVGNETDKSRVH